MAHYKIKVVFRTIKHGSGKGELECLHAVIPGNGFCTVANGDRYYNEWYLNNTRPATVEEYREELAAMNRATFGDDTYEFIPVARRIW